MGVLTQSVDCDLAAGQEVNQELDAALADCLPALAMHQSAVVLEVERLLERWGSAAVVAPESPHLHDHCRHLRLLLSHSNPYCQIVLLLGQLHASLA